MLSLIETPKSCIQTQTNPILSVSWDSFDASAKKLAAMIEASGWQFDKIVAIARGGLPLATQLSHLLNKKMAVIFASSYEGENEQTRGKIQINTKIAMLTDTLGKRILLVDDLIDSGVTLKEIIRTLKENHADVEEIKTVVLYAKTGAAITSDYCIDNNIDKNTWICFPYEKPIKNT